MEELQSEISIDGAPLTGDKTNLPDRRRTDAGSQVTTLKILVFVNALVPLALLAYDASRGRLGANPIEFFLRTTGVMTLIFLVLTLSITPLRILTGINELIKTRRMVGLFSFFYGVIHFLTYSIFDKSGEPLLIADDVIQRPFIAIGMAVLLILIPLAATSTNRMVKRLGGRNWARLHRLTYLAAMLGVVHYWMSVKSDITYPALFGIAVAGLLGYRIYAMNYVGRSRGN